MGSYFIGLTAREMTFCSTYGKTTQNRQQEPLITWREVKHQYTGIRINK